MTALFKTTLFSSALICGILTAAHAQVVTDGYGESADYGYGGGLVRGEYIGAPFTRVPRPSELVPNAWGYGTYGIPTVAGIRPAPTGTPTLYVIETPARVSPSRVEARPRILARARDGRWLDRAPRARPGFHRETVRSLGNGISGARVIPVHLTR